jgi:hypothetical protein
MAQAISRLSRERLEKILHLSIFSAVLLTQFSVWGELPIGFESAKISVLQIVAVVCLVTLLLSLLPLLKKMRLGKFTYSQLRDKRLLLGITIAVSFVIAVLSVVFSAHAEIALYGSQFRSQGLIAVASIYSIFFYFLFLSRARESYYLYLYLFFAAIHAAIALSESISNSGDLLLAAGNFVNGNFGQSNFLAAVMLSALIISAYFFYCQKTGLSRKFSVFAFVLFSTVIMLTESKAVVATAVLLVIVIYLRYNFQVRVRDDFIGIAVFSIAMLFYTFYQDGSRNLYWSTAMELFVQDPKILLIGNGPDTLLAYARDNQIFPAERVIDRFHNLQLDLIFSFGVFYISSILLALYDLSKNAVKKLSDSQFIILLICLCFVITAQVHTKSIYHFAQFAAFSGILCSGLLRENS